MIDDEPVRVLVLSAQVGQGHVAAARALAGRMRSRWPAAVVHEVESTGRGGARRDRLVEACYSLTLRRLPGLYGFAYDALARYPAATRWAKRGVAAVLGRALAPLIAAQRPDLVVSTYPMTSAGLAWLRRRGALPGYAVAVVTDLAVHPFWVWPELDQIWTSLPESARQARRPEPAAAVRVTAAPVHPRFLPGDRAAARAELGLRADALVVLATGGSLGLGSLPKLVDAALAAGERVQVVAVCGYNDGMRAELHRRALPGSRLVVHGWTDRMDVQIRAADVVLTTAGGVIALEALAVGRPVLFAAPVPGHGRASAATMAAAGLALLCPGPADVTGALRRLLTEPSELAELTCRAVDHAGARSLDEDLDDLARAVSSSRPPAAGAVRGTPGSPGR